MNIAYLAHHKDEIPKLAQWFFHEWGYLYPERTVEDVERLIGERLNTASIPLALVAFEGNDLVGTICLKAHDMDSHPKLTPWLAGLYVAEPWRRNGIGSELVSAIEQQANNLGVQKLYLYTPESELFYSNLGWQVREREEYHGYPVTIMEKKIIYR